MKLVSIAIRTTPRNELEEIGAIIFDPSEKFSVSPAIDAPHFRFKNLKFSNKQQEFEEAFGIDSQIEFDSVDQQIEAKHTWFAFHGVCPADEIMVLFKDFLHQNGIEKVIPVGDFNLQILKDLPFSEDINFAADPTDPRLMYIGNTQDIAYWMDCFDKENEKELLFNEKFYPLKDGVMWEAAALAFLFQQGKFILTF